MTHPLLHRLTADLNWPALDDADALDAYTATPGTHVVFLPGDPARNLETADVAVILPELRQAFQGRFDCALAAGAAEAAVKDTIAFHKTPNLVFYRDGAPIGTIPRVRDWDDYVMRVAQILNLPLAAE